MNRQHEAESGGRLNPGELGAKLFPPTWTAQRVAMATLTALGVGLVFWLLIRFYMVVFVFLVAVTLQIAMKPAVTWLRRHRVPPHLGVALVYTALVGLFVAFTWLAAPLLIQQATTLAQQMPEHYQTARETMAGSSNWLVSALGISLPEKLSLGAAPVAGDAQPMDAVSPAWQGLQQITSGFLALIVIFMLAYYWTLDGDRFIRRGILLAPPSGRDALREIITELENKVGGYFRGQTMLCVIVATLSFVGYLLIGLPYAFGLALLMGLFEAVPMIGPVLGAIPAILVAVTIAPDKLLWVIGVVLVVQIFESNLLVPRVMDRAVGVNAVVAILAIAAFGLLFGLGGAILAIPLAAMLQILFNRFVLRIPLDEETDTVAPDLVVGERNVSSVLRLKAQDLAHDLRKQTRSRTDEELAEPALELAADQLEAIATDLDTVLRQMEGAK